jgi:ABC-type transporter Mla MlaB component
VFTGAERLEQLLRELLASNLEAVACWTLLLDLLQLQGRQADYEAAAMDYGIALLVDPPQWQVLLLPKPPVVAVQEKRTSPRYESGSDLFRLSDSMIGGDDAQFAALMLFASDKRYLNIHFAALQRLDPDCAAHLVRTFSAWRRDGKIVRLIGVNTLVAALLILLDAQHHAEFVLEKGEL